MPKLTVYEAVAKVVGCSRQHAAEILGDLALEGYFIWPDELASAEEHEFIAKCAKTAFGKLSIYRAIEE